MRRRKRKRPQVAMSPSGDVFVEVSAIYSAEECAELVRSGSALICVQLTPKESDTFHEALDNALAEVVARIGGARHRTKRR